MLQGVSERLTAFREKFQVSGSKRTSVSSESFLARPDDTGRMDVVTRGPGFEFHLRHVDLLTVSRDKTSGDFRFAVLMADRDTVASARARQ